MNCVQNVVRTLTSSYRMPLKLKNSCKLTSLFSKTTKNSHSLTKAMLEPFGKINSRNCHKLYQRYDSDEIKMIGGIIGGLITTACISGYFFIIRPFNDLVQITTVGDNNDPIAVATFLLEASTEKPILLKKYLKRYFVDKSILNACVEKIIKNPNKKNFSSLIALVNAGAFISDDLFCYAIKNCSIDLVKACLSKEFRVKSKHIDLSIQIGNAEIINCISKQFSDNDYVYSKLVKNN